MIGLPSLSLGLVRVALRRSHVGSHRNKKLLLGIRVPRSMRRARLVFVVTLSNRGADRATRWASRVLASSIVTQHIPAAHTVLNSTLLVPAVSNMLPKLLHACAVRRNRAFPRLVLTFRSMPQQKKPLLLMTDFLPFRIVPPVTARAVGRRRRLMRRSTLVWRLSRRARRSATARTVWSRRRVLHVSSLAGRRRH